MNLFPAQGSTFAAQVDALYAFLLVMSGIMAVFICTLLAYFAIRYRRRAKVDRSDPPTHATLLELVWTAIPLAVFLFIFFWGARLYLVWASPPPNALEVYGVAKQWMWKFQHTEGPREINELHVPVGRPMKVVLASEDVIHSFYVPAFRVKMDAVPGRYTSVWFEASEPGEYRLFCAEYCGTGHSRMTGHVIAMAESDYQRWLGGGVGEETLAQQGAILFERLGCKSCHAPEVAPDQEGLASAVRGPPLTNIFQRQVVLAGGAKLTADEDYLRESILRPQAKIVDGYKPLMPTYEGQLDEDSLAALIAFLKASR